MPRRYRLFACEVFREEVESLLPAIPAALDIAWLEMGLHDQPEKLNAELRNRLAAERDRSDVDATLLLFGLCSNATLGLAAGKVPLVIPRVHDCISLFLGSAARYREEHEKEPGTYWFARGFIHRKTSSTYAGGLMGHAPGEEAYTPERREAMYKSYVEQYGEENADYLMDVWVDAWRKNYKRAVLFSWTHAEAAADRERVQALAGENGWRFEEIPANLRLVRGLLSGDWPAEEFLVVPPGRSVAATHDAAVLGCAACGVC